MKKRSDGTYIFPDHPEFRPNVSPREMFQLGVLGGTYWRRLKNPFDGLTYMNEYKQIPSLADLPESIMSSSTYSPSKNRYGVKAGSSFETWHRSGWLRPSAWRGWIMWYSLFFEGLRTDDDSRQIKRWQAFINRFKNRAASSDVVKQNLLEWGVLL
jgi:hypothetical protein